MGYQLKTTEDLELWLQENPDPADVYGYLEYVEFWVSKLREGGNGYVTRTRSLGTKYLADIASGKEPI